MQIQSPSPDPTTETIQTGIFDVVAFFIPGEPLHEGSALKSWHATIATYASEQGRAFSSPIAVTLRFTVPAESEPAIIELTGAVLHGLADGGLIKDVVAVVDLHASEIRGDHLGVHVIVRAI